MTPDLFQIKTAFCGDMIVVLERRVVTRIKHVRVNPQMYRTKKRKKK